MIEQKPFQRNNYSKQTFSYTLLPYYCHKTSILTNTNHITGDLMTIQQHATRNTLYTDLKLVTKLSSKVANIQLHSALIQFLGSFRIIEKDNIETSVALIVLKFRLHLIK